MVNDKVKQILLPIDTSKPSEKGLKKAIYYAKIMNAEITGVNVITVHPTLASTVLDYKKFVTQKTERFLETVQKKCEKEGVKFNSKILYGKPSTEITKYAQKKNFDLIIIGSRGLTGLKRAIMGSIASAIVQKSKTSVLVVK